MSGFKFSTGQHTIKSPDGPTVINIQSTGRTEQVGVDFWDKEKCEMRFRYEDVPLYTMDVNGIQTGIEWTEKQITDMAAQFAQPAQAIFLPGNVGLI